MKPRNTLSARNYSSNGGAKDSEHADKLVPKEVNSRRSKGSYYYYGCFVESSPYWTINKNDPAQLGLPRCLKPANCE